MAEFTYPLHKVGVTARARRSDRSVPVGAVTPMPSASGGFSEWSSSDIITSEQITGGIDPETGLQVQGTAQRNAQDAARLLNNPRVVDEGDRSFLEMLTGAAGTGLGMAVGGTLNVADRVEQWIPGKQLKPSTTAMTIMEALGRLGTTSVAVYEDIIPNFAKGSFSNANELLQVIQSGFDEQAVDDWINWGTKTNTELLYESGQSTTGDLGWNDYMDILTGKRLEVEERLGLRDLGAGSYNTATSNIDRDAAFWDNPLMANWLSAERLLTGAGTDIVLDPITYVTGGTAGVGAKATLPIVRGALERSTLKVARDLVAGGVPKMARELAEKSAVAAKYADDPIARRLAEDLVVKVPKLIADDSARGVTNVTEALEELIGLGTKRTFGVGEAAVVTKLKPADWFVSGAKGAGSKTNVWQGMMDEIAGEIQNKSFGRYVDDGSWWRTFEDAVVAHSDVAMKPWMLGGLRISPPVFSPRLANRAISIPGTQGMKRAITSKIKAKTGTSQWAQRADDWTRDALNRNFAKQNAALADAARLGASNPSRGSYSQVVAARAEAEWAVANAGLDGMLETMAGLDGNVHKMLIDTYGKIEGKKIFASYVEVMADGDFTKVAGKVDKTILKAMQDSYAGQRRVYNQMQTEYLKWDPDMADWVRHANYQPMIKTRQAQKWLNAFTTSREYKSRIPELEKPELFDKFAMEIQQHVNRGRSAAERVDLTAEDIWTFKELLEQHTGFIGRNAPQATPNSQKFRKLGRDYIMKTKDDAGVMTAELRDIHDLNRAMTAIIGYVNETRKIPLPWKDGSKTIRTGLKSYAHTIDGFFELDPTIRLSGYVEDIGHAIATRAQATAGFKYGFIVRNGKYIKPGLVAELFATNTAHLKLDEFFVKRAEILTAHELELLLAKASVVTHTVAGREFRYPIDMASEHFIQVLDNLDLIFGALREQAPGLQQRFNTAVIHIKQANPDMSIEQARSQALRTSLPTLYEAQETFLIGLGEEVVAYSSGLKDWFSVVGAGELEARLRAKVMTSARAQKLVKEYQRLEKEIIGDAIDAGDIVQGRSLTDDELTNLATEMRMSHDAKVKAAKNEVDSLRVAQSMETSATDPLGHESQRLAASVAVADEARRILEEGPRKAINARVVYTSNDQYAPPGVAEALGGRHQVWDKASKTQGSVLNMVKQSNATVLFWHPSWSSRSSGKTKLDLNRFVQWITEGENPAKAMTSYSQMWDFFNRNYVAIGHGVYVSRPHTARRIVVVAAFDTIDGAPTAMAAAQRALGDADSISVVGWPEVMDTGSPSRIVDADIFFSDTMEHKARIAMEETQPAAPTQFLDQLAQLNERAAKGKLSPNEAQRLERISKHYERAKKRAADHNVDGYLVEDLASALFMNVQDFIDMNWNVIRPLPGASQKRFELNALRAEKGRIAQFAFDPDDMRKIKYEVAARDALFPGAPTAPVNPEDIKAAFRPNYPWQSASDLPYDEVPGWVKAFTPYGELEPAQLAEAWQHLHIAVFEGLEPMDSIDDLIWALEEHWPLATVYDDLVDEEFLTKNELRTIAQDWIEVKYHDPDLDAAGRRRIAELDDEASPSLSGERMESSDLYSGEFRETRQMMSSKGIGSSGSKGAREKAENQLLAFENRFESRHGGNATPAEFRRYHLKKVAEEDAIESATGVSGKLYRVPVQENVDEIYGQYVPMGVEIRVRPRTKYQPRQFKAKRFDPKDPQSHTPQIKELETTDPNVALTGGGTGRGFGDIEFYGKNRAIPTELEDPELTLLPQELREKEFNPPRAEEVIGHPEDMQALGDYSIFVETTLKALFNDEMSHTDSLLAAAYDAIRPDFENKLRQIDDLLHNDATYLRWLREHSINPQHVQDVIDSYRSTHDIGMLMGGGPSLMFEKIVALADARAGIELTPGASTVNRLTHIDASQFAEMSSKQLGESLKNLGVAGRSKARTKSQRLALLDELFFGNEPARVETAYLKQPFGDRMANTATLPDGSKLVQIHLGSIIADYKAGLPYLRGTSKLAMKTSGRASDALYSIGVEVDDLLAWFERNGGEWAYADFIRNHEYVHAVDPQNLKLTDLMAKEMHANVVALRTIGYPIDEVIQTTTAAKVRLPQGRKGTYEVSTAGDKRFSAFNARIKGRDNRSIEELYQIDIKGYASMKEGKGKPPLDPTTDTATEYDNLWREWAQENPEPMAELTAIAMDNRLTDRFATAGANNQAATLERIIEERMAVTPPVKVISGGQLGADMWMVEAGQEAGIETGGHISKMLMDRDKKLRERAVLFGFEASDPEDLKAGNVGHAYAARTIRNVNAADVTISWLPAGMGDRSRGTTNTIRYSMDGVWDKRVPGDVEQVAPYLWRVVNPNGSPTHRISYIISGPLEDSGVKVLAGEIRGRTVNGAGPKFLADVLEDELAFKDSMRRVFSESRQATDGFVVPQLIHAKSKLAPARGVRGRDVDPNISVNVGRGTSGGVDKGKFGNRYVVQELQADGTLYPPLPLEPHPTFTVREAMPTPSQSMEPQRGLIIPKAQRFIGPLNPKRRQVPAPYIGLVVGENYADRMAANRAAVQGYADDLDRAMAFNPDFADEVGALQGKQLQCPGKHGGLCHSDVLADRVNKFNNIGDTSPEPQITAGELSDRISMVRNSISQKAETVQQMAEKFDNVVSAARINPDEIVATIAELNKFSSGFNQPAFSRLWASKGPALREAIAGLRPGLELQVQWATDPASGLRSGVLRVVAPGDEAVLMAGKKADISELVDDIVSGTVKREDAIASGMGKAVLAADIKQELIDSVGAVAQFMQARIGTRKATYYPQKRLIRQFDVLVKSLNIATSTGRTKSLRTFLGEFSDDGALRASSAWKNLQYHIDQVSPERGNQLRWWVDTALAADGWDDIGRYHAWHEQQMQITYNAGYTEKTIFDGLRKEIKEVIDNSLYFTSEEAPLAVKTNQEIFAAMLGLQEGALGPRQPMNTGGNRFIEAVEGYGPRTPSSHPPKGYQLTAQQHVMNHLDALENAKRQLQLNNTKGLAPEGYRDSMELIDAAIAADKKTLENIQEAGMAVENPAGYLPAKDFGFEESLFTDTYMDPLYAEAMQMTKDNAMLLFTPYGMAEISQSVNTLVALWKRWATVINPSFHARNLVGGVANGWMIGVKPTDYIKWGPLALKWRKGMQAVNQGGLSPEDLEDVLHRVILKDIPLEYHKMFDDAMTTRTLGSSFARADSMAPTTAELSANPLNPDFILYQLGGRVMEGMEDVMRLTAFATNYNRGAESAAALVKMVHFDYSDLTPLEKKIKTIIPFYVWTRHNVPLQFRMLLESPGYFRKYEIIRKSWNEQVLEREEDPNRQAWGTYLAAGEGFLTPWRRGDDNDWAWKMIQPDLPFNDLAELPMWQSGFGYEVNPIGDLGVGRSTQYLWDLIGPQFNVFSDLEGKSDGLSRNAPRGFQGVLSALDAMGIYDTKISRDGDRSWPDSINQTINKVAPFYHNYVAMSGARASNPYRAADEGWLDGDAPAWWEPMRWGLGFDRFVGRGVGSKWETPKNAYFEQNEVSQIIARITRDARLGNT